ncbi:MAG: DUF1800 domain-containing protein [Methylovulum sp.]|uniref:DUF1800 domain-containing protein n=1 Tax=Methylovulum sp. TaxID=1916980 RepID=UPI00263108A3|nr:DUF1800 domain-containing protein [Methylovulum sp.]MDD2722539.1 DUF1800 domain-containing protein [Methylovulum sp.]MDD5123067.1 DUF1800 domain-containing protein [Methylovulum sp.]
MIKLLKILGLLACYLPALLFAAPLSGEDIKWLNRVTYGIDNVTLNAYVTEGRAGYLKRQLDNRVDDRLPARVAELIGGMRISTEPVKMTVSAFQEAHKRLKSLPVEQRNELKKATNQPLNQRINETMQRHLLRAMYSPAQIKEQLVWFWFNHFNVSKDKGALNKILVSDYEERAIRPYVLGKFRDLLMATLRHPAMLVYLDNVQNANGKINENYARELMELHTLGVDGGYSQQDVQELARILTGAGMNWTDNYPRLNAKLETYYLHDGGFEFNPKRHDFGEKLFLGKKIAGNGFAEIEQVVDMLARHPSTARFISTKLAMFFVADVPPPDLVGRMGKAFLASDGDISATLRVLFDSKEFIASLGSKAKDPLHYIVSALRFAYEDRPISDMLPAIHWLINLGEPLYSHPTPDGYGMNEKDWLSPEQLTRRFEIAKIIASGKAKLTGGDVDPKTLVTPVLANKLSYQALEPSLSVQTKNALAKSVSQPEWNTFFLSSPEFLYR